MLYGLENWEHQPIQEKNNNFHKHFLNVILQILQVLHNSVSIVSYNLLKGFYSNYHQNKNEEQKD